MAHKHKKSHKVNPDIRVTAVESEIQPESVKTTKPATSTQPQRVQEEPDMAWQVIFVIVAIVGGVLVMVAKALGVF